jgi:hypothetical protein
MKISAADSAARLRERSGYIYDPKLVGYFSKFIKDNVNKQESDSSRSGVPLTDLKKGMYMAEDLYLQNGMLLVPRGVILDEATIDKINSFESLIDSGRIVSVVG